VARRGEVIRFLFTNVSNTRTLNLSFPGAKMKVVGSDAGNYEHEQWVESVVIAPAERYIVHVRFDVPGDVSLVNRVQGLDHLFGRFFYEADTLGVVHVGAEGATPDLARAFARLRADRAATADIDRYRKYFDKPVDHSLLLTIEGHNLPFVSRQLMMLDSAYFVSVEWSGTMPTMNWASTADQIRWVLRRSGYGQREHGHRLDVPSRRRPKAAPGERAPVDARHAAPDPPPWTAIPRSGGERRAQRQSRVERHGIDSRGIDGRPVGGPIESRAVDATLSRRRAPVGGDDDGFHGLALICPEL
jgi:hypothetical protein